MARTPVVRGTVGRPQHHIDWNEVDQYLLAGSPGTAIAAIFGFSVSTLYERCLREKGVNFQEYSRQKKSKGDELIRMKQFQEAMNGDKTLLIWLGKNRLSQKEKHDLAHSGDVKYNIVHYGDRQLVENKGDEDEEEDEELVALAQKSPTEIEYQEEND